MGNASLKNEDSIKELWAWVGSIDWHSSEFYGLQSALAKDNDCTKQAIRQALKRQKNLRIAVELREKWQARHDAARKVMA